MNALQITVLAAIAVFFALLVIRPRYALTYGRYTVLAAAAIVVLLPFFWLFCAAIKDKDALNTYVFLPPAHTWFKVTEIPPDEIATTQATAAKVTPAAPVPATPPTGADSPPAGADLPTTGPTTATTAPPATRPATLSLDNFRQLFAPRKTLEGEITFFRHILNSIFLASASTAISLFFSSLGGYALAKYKFPGRAALLTFMLASLTIPGVSLLAPSYKIIYSLGWLDTYYALLVPGAVSVFGLFLFRQAMTGIPDDLIEAGRIDGCGEFAIYLKLVMPLVRPMSGAFCLVSFLGAWNSFMGPNIFLTTQSKMPLPVVLNQYIGEYQQQYGVFLAGTLLAIIPPAILFLALQREFISGLTSGAVKQ